MLGDGFVRRCELRISIGNNKILRDRLVHLVLDLKNLVVLDSVSALFFEHRRFLPLNPLRCFEPTTYHSIINFLLFVKNHSLNKLILKNLFGRKSLVYLPLEWRKLDFRFFFLFILLSFLSLFRFFGNFSKLWLIFPIFVESLEMSILNSAELAPFLNLVAGLELDLVHLSPVKAIVSRLKVLVLSRVVFIAHSIHVNTGLL